jgi:hypothetical protein
VQLADRPKRAHVRRTGLALAGRCIGSRALHREQPPLADADTVTPVDLADRPARARVDRVRPCRLAAFRPGRASRPGRARVLTKTIASPSPVTRQPDRRTLLPDRRTTAAPAETAAPCRSAGSPLTPLDCNSRPWQCQSAEVAVRGRGSASLPRRYLGRGMPASGPAGPNSGWFRSARFLAAGPDSSVRRSGLLGPVRSVALVLT